MIETVTPLILTYNEEANIQRVLQRLTWAKQILMLDSFSDDRTLEIAATFPQVSILQRRFDCAANQCNYGLEQIQSEWVLSLDADYVLSDALIQEIQTLVDSPLVDAYQVNFKYCVQGKMLRGTLLPPRTVLYRRAKASYYTDGHTQRVRIEGTSAMLKGVIYHDDRKSLSRWLQSQDRYMILEAKKLLSTADRELSWSDRLRKRKLFAPFLVFFYCLLFKGGILDGWAGWYYAFQRTIAELWLAIYLIDLEHLIE
ncbi:glycosyltransferase family 2 protein [Tumidithrix helvetica PCC 7403]|uniref:glycosyltransferase family 2 protein n=1 Tax=Tumidithrix helvetica TaxID=3457545 RepID=UPI003CB8451E